MKWADAMCKLGLGFVMKPIMTVFGLGSQVDQIQEAIKSGKPDQIAVAFVQLICMLFGLTSQCFTGDTLVSTETGLRPIKEIQVGDYVWAEDTETGEIELKKVLAVSVTESDTLVHVTTENGTKIDTTENHPFYVEGKGWTAAAELKSGDVLHTKDGETETVSEVEVEKLEEAVKVYNLEVEDSHTYYVSVDRVLVHNTYEWNKGSFDTPEESLQYHYNKHHKEVGANNIQQYLNKVEGFLQNLKRAKRKKVPGEVEGVIRYIKNGRFIDLAPDNSVISFGATYNLEEY